MSVFGKVERMAIGSQVLKEEKIGKSKEKGFIENSHCNGSGG
jgi:hypothetical protein